MAVTGEDAGDTRGNLDPIEALPGAERNLTQAVVKPEWRVAPEAGVNDLGSVARPSDRAGNQFR